MEVKAGYKKTEVGIIPDDWQVTTLANVSRMKSGESITAANIDLFSEYPCYGGNGLRGFTSRFTHDGNYALIGRQGALCGNVLGVSGKFFASEHAVVVTPFEQTAIRWLTYVLEDMNLNQYSESSAQSGLSVAKILNLPLAVPPTKNEQEAIAQALSDADALIEGLEGLIAKKRQVKQGALQELLTGKRRLPGFEQSEFKQTDIGLFPNDWNVIDYVSLGQIIDGDRGVNYPGANDFRESGYCLFLNAGNVTKTGFRFDECQFITAEKDKKLRKGKLVRGDCVLTTRGTVGNFAYFTNDVPFDHIRINSGMVVLRNMSPEINNDYHYLVLRSDVIASQLTVKGIGTIKIPIPPTKEGQTAIAEILSDMDAEITALEAKLSTAREVKAGMMSALLGGKIRLVES